MELLQLKYFCSAARAESMTAAARKHGIPQSAISKTVAKLEDELGTPLFDRVGNRIRLNENGRQFLEHIQNGLAEIENGIAAVKEETAYDGEIKILVLENRRLITDRILAFHKKYPTIRFSICHNTYEQTHSDFDLYISSFPQSSDAYHSHPIINERIMLAVYNTHRLATHPQVELCELENEDFIFLPKQSSVSRIMTMRCRRNGFEPHIVITCDDPYYVRKYISAGFGIAFTPSDSWTGLYDSNITLLPINDADAVRITSVYWHKTRYISKAALLFRDFLIGADQNAGSAAITTPEDADTTLPLKRKHDTDKDGKGA
ncbi:MAG: LysR family transcriptional regulator [Clostridiales bacterium]|nr:LysR family transcriptional regulator [Clostridiales bacterium]